MLFLAYCEDIPGTDDKRAALREQHMSYLNATPAVVVLGGATFDAGDARVGSCMIVDAADYASAKTWFENEPWSKAGLFKSMSVTRVQKGVWHPELVA